MCNEDRSWLVGGTGCVLYIDSCKHHSTLPEYSPEEPSVQCKHQASSWEKLCWSELVSLTKIIHCQPWICPCIHNKNIFWSNIRGNWPIVEHFTNFQSVTQLLIRVEGSWHHHHSFILFSHVYLYHQVIRPILEPIGGRSIGSPTFFFYCSSSLVGCFGWYYPPLPLQLNVAVHAHVYMVSICSPDEALNAKRVGT